MAINLDHVTEQITVTDTATNASLTVQPKGTGAFNIAAGSSGVNLSNGGTVTAITRTVAGSGYTSVPSVAISAPTTAGGVQAIATANVGPNSIAVTSGGTGYTLNDVLTLVGGTGTALVVTVTAVSGGVVTSVAYSSGGIYTVAPSNPVSTTGGTGSGCTLTLTYYVNAFTITNAGSGYVEQPTVTFSGGGGSGAAAYATVGSAPIIRSLAGSGSGAQSLSFYGSSGEAFRLNTSTTSLPAINYGYVSPGAQNNGIQIGSQGADTNVWLGLTTKGSGNVQFLTGGGNNEQLRVAHTASAVNYVQLTGGVTGGNVQISAQGTDASTGISLVSKGGGGSVWKGDGGVYFQNNASNNLFSVENTSSTVNRLTATGSVTGSGPRLFAQGSDTNIDLNLTTKGTGVHKFNTGGGEQVRVTDRATANRYLTLQGGLGGTQAPSIGVGGGGEALDIYSTSGFNIWFSTNGIRTATQFAVGAVASAVNYVQAAGSTTGASVTLSSQGSDTNIGFIVRTKGSGAFTPQTEGTYFQNLSAQNQFAVTNTASAVNYAQVTGAITANYPIISGTGSDTNVGLLFRLKGTPTGPGFRIENNNGANVCFAVTTSGASVVNYPRADPSATGFGAGISAQGSDTNIPLVLQPKGTGALQAQQTDSTATGGNARGANAVDWQTSRSAASSVASGANAVVGGGASNGATGQYSGVLSGVNSNATGFATVISGGWNNSATGGQSVLVGGYSNTSGGPFNFVGGGASNSGTANAAVTTQSGTMNATTAVTLSGSNANIKVGQLITGTSIASFTYVAAISGTSLTLSQAASGSSTSTLSFFTPHGVVVGGGNNQATGSYSFIGGGGDAGTSTYRNVASGNWSTVGGGRGNTASGTASFVGGGGTDGTNAGSNTASGTFSAVVCGFSNSATGTGSFVASGYTNAANGDYSSVLGGTRGNTRSIQGNFVLPACVVPIADASGITQSALLVLAVQTTDATATVLRSNTAAAGTTNQVILPNNSAYFFTGEVVAGVTGGGDTKGWKIEGVIKRGANAASTALVGTPTVTSSYADAGASTWTIAVTADTTNGGLAVTFTGQASTTIRTVAKISTTEMTY